MEKKRQNLPAVDLVHEVFRSYCDSYREALNTLGFEPWTISRKTIHESNQVRRFLNAYEGTGKNIITWMELPVPFEGGKMKAETAHIDGFIADRDRRLIFFIEAKRFSRESQVRSLKKDMKRIFNISQKIYVGDGRFKGLDLFKFDAYALALADIWSDKNVWTNAIATEWKDTCSELESIYSIIEASEICEVFPSYHLTYTCMPVFCAEDYKEAVLKAKKSGGPKPDPSILVWADDMKFENLLAAVNIK